MHALQESEAEVRQLAFNDPLTGLANRRLLDDRINQVLLHCMRNKKHGGIIIFDLDKFKPLNDTFGHAAGDEVLVEVARRVVKLVRVTDTVSRVGGDEFVVLLDDLGDHPSQALENARKLAENICSGLSEPYRISGMPPKPASLEYRCTASVGIAVFNDQASLARARHDADDALYRAKSEGGGCVKSPRSLI